MNENAGAFRYGGESWIPISDPAVRASDIAARCLTLTRQRDGAVVTIPAKALDTHPLDQPPRHGRKLHLRELAEEIVARGFNESWCAMIVKFVSDQGLLLIEPESDT